MRHRAALFLAAVMALALGGAYADEPLVPGARAPHFAGRTVDGQTLNLASTRGRVTLLSFMLTSYKDEEQHLRTLEQLRARLEPRGLSVLSVALDQSRPEAVVAFLKRCGVRHPVFSDPERKIADKFGVQAAPTLYLIDPHGVIVRYQEGYMPGDEKSLVSTVEALINRELGSGDHPDRGVCHCYAPRP